MLMYNANKSVIAFYVMYVFVFMVLMLYGTECSVRGSHGLGACATFSWVLVAMSAVIFFTHLAYGIFAHIALKNNAEKNNK